MNKDVIYIEPEDDITDIIAKIENAKEKIVALVPPKKAGVFRSSVNIKLIAKAGASTGKSVVIVTTDPSVVKLAAASRLPVTKNLQTAPVIPKIEDAEDEEESTEEVTSSDEDAEEDDAEEEGEEENDEEDTESAEEGEEGEPKSDDDKKDGKDKKKKPKKESKLANSKNPALKWIGTHKKIAIAGVVAFVVLLIVGIWAFAIAPAVKLTIGLRTTTSNFSENVTFTDVATDENASEGKFYLVEKKLEQKAEQEFTATGKKDIGDHAKGTLAISAYFKTKGAVTVDKGAIFTYNGLAYGADDAVTLSWDEKSTTACANNGQSSLVTYGCLITGEIGVTAVEAGEKYNIAASETGWNTAAHVNAYSKTAMAGGTSNVVTVVQQSDVDAAAKEMITASEADTKKTLYDQITDTEIAIDSSFKQSTGDIVSTPAVGEEVKEGVTPKASVTTTATMYAIDKVKVEEFISRKAKLAENFKIYSMNDPFVENFMKGENGYSGKLKTSYTSGPKVTENEIVEIVKGKGLGVAQHDLKDIDGIGSITIDTSVPWVMSIPNNPDKITVVLEVTE